MYMWLMDGYGCSGSPVLHAVEASKASSNSMMFPNNRGEDCSNLREALAQFWECIYPLCAATIWELCPMVFESSILSFTNWSRNRLRWCSAQSLLQQDSVGGTAYCSAGTMNGAGPHPSSWWRVQKYTCLSLLVLIGLYFCVSGLISLYLTAQSQIIPASTLWMSGWMPSRWASTKRALPVLASPPLT